MYVTYVHYFGHVILNLYAIKIARFELSSDVKAIKIS